jgi:methylenetetrahydrofolate reductase (NADPH)
MGADPDPAISRLLGRPGRPTVSLEFFPPKEDAGLRGLRRQAEALQAMRPDFVTVTYGAGGSTRDRSLAVCEMLRGLDLGPVMPHLTCVGSTRADLARTADDLFDRGYRNIMALRGDPPRGSTEFRAPPGGLAYGADLVAFLKDRHPEFCCGVAGYPEGHPESPDADTDLRHLADKVRAGADFITTQLFYDNRLYARFAHAIAARGIGVPVLAGLLPATSLAQVERIMSFCRASLPGDLRDRLASAGDRAEAGEEAGLAWAADQIRGLAGGVAPGIHLYFLNRSRTALAPALADAVERFRAGAA